MASVDLVVLGAGPAGVAAAWRAACTGRRVVVLERATAPGGAAASLTVGGVRVDHGSHRLHPATDPSIMRDLRALLGDELQERTRNGRIRLADRWIGFPLRAADLLRRLPPSFTAGAVFDTFTAALRRPRADTFEEVIRAGLGPTMWARFYGPYAQKIWGVDPATLSGEQARRRVSADSPLKLMRRVVTGSTRRPTFLYPRSGFGTIVERMADAAVEAGADLRLGRQVSAVRLGGDGASVQTAAGEAVHADRVFSTIPLTALAAMTTPRPPVAALAAAESLQFRAMTLVYLVLDVGRWTDYDAHYLPEPSTPITRVSEPKNYRSGDEPPGRTVLCAEIPCSRGDAVWSADAEALGGLVADDLSNLGLPRPRPVEAAVRRLARAYPIYTTGYEKDFEELDAWAAAQPRLLTFGRQGLFAHDNTHHAMAMAYEAVGCLGAGGSFDHHRWAAARRRFRGHVVED